MAAAFGEKWPPKVVDPIQSSDQVSTGGFLFKVQVSR